MKTHPDVPNDLEDGTPVTETHPSEAESSVYSAGSDLDTAIQKPPAEIERPPVSAIIESVNPYAFTMGLFGIIVLTRVTSYLTPYKLYFSFAGFLFSDDERSRWTALILKLAIPVLVGLLLFYVPHHFLRISDIKSTRIARYLRLQADLTARFSAFFAALLMAWPFIVYWDLMAPPNLVEHRLAFFLIYLLYLVSYSYFGGVGISLGKWLAGATLSDAEKRNIRGPTALLEGVRTSLLGIATSAIATYLGSNLAHPH